MLNHLPFSRETLVHKYLGKVHAVIILNYKSNIMSNLAMGNENTSVLPNTSYLWTNCRPTAVIFPTERHSNLLWQSERGTVWYSADHTSLRLCVWSGWRQRAGETRALLQPLSSLRHFYTMPSTARRCTYKGTNGGSKSSLKACAMQKPVLLDTMYKTACLYSALHVERCEEMHFIKSWMPHCLNALADRNIRHDDMHWMEISVYQFQGDN